MRRPERVLLVRVVNIEGDSHPAFVGSQAVADADLVICFDDEGRSKVVKSREPVEVSVS